MRTHYLETAHTAPTSAEGLAPFLIQFDPSHVPHVPMSQPVAEILLCLEARFPLADNPIWKESPNIDLLRQAEMLVKKTPPESPAGNDILLAHWAVTGDLPSLTELVRRVMNRDGSSAADSLGSDAISLLSDAEATDPYFAMELADCNFSLGRLKFGNFPPGSVSLPLVSAPPPPSPRAQPVARALRDLPVVQSAVNGGPAANRDSGTVDVGGVKMSISAAVKLSDGLARAVTELLRPAEGFTWLNDSADPQARSILVDLDGKRGEGLPDVGGGLCQAEVIQVAARGPDPNTGKYIGRLYNRQNGYSEFKTDSDDMNTAKFMVAERVRADLQT
jgi:hypothetical protein